jgi:hypothetical protein
MRMGRPGWMTCRAVITLAALYALALQLFLSGALVASVPDQAHILCAPEVGSAADNPIKAPPAHNHLACCMAAQDLVGASLPLLTSVAVVWPPRRIAIIGWRPEVVASPRAPPGISTSARAPPIV